ncbi:hypothetical protein V6N11_080784 [Hibiscus sabdariffa]|uniref:SWIM-type domain-containing protein n=1 Tax=Hibiscus sabdariffa TaxID=183260 RepID=A0ABR2QHW8_9ROSI
MNRGEKRQTKVKIRFHHCGAFEGNPKSTYLDGKVQVVEHHDIEELCYWDLLLMVHQLKYGLNKVKCLYFLEPGKSLEDGLKLLFDDNSVLEFSNCLKSVGEISIYVDHIGDENDKFTDVPLPKALFKTIDESSNKHGKEITMDDTEDDLDMHDINLSSDEGNDELVGAREKVTKYVNDLVRLNIDDVDGSFPSQTRGTKDHSVESSRTHCMTDDGLDSDYIDSDDSGSYITTSDDSDADDARRVQSRTLSYNPSISNQGFFVGQIFRDSSQFRTALNDHSLEKRFSIKTYISEHSCLPTIHKKRVTSNVIASKLRDEISRMPYMKATDIRALVRQKLGVMVNISKVRRAKLQVIKSIQEKYIEEFKILREYCDELCETNLGQEDTYNWKWFLELLMNDFDIVDGIGLTIISNMQKNDHGPRILAKLEKSRVLASKWEVDWNGGIYHEVFYVNTIDNIRESYTICLRNSTCTCQGWDINGVPCPHAFSAIIYEGGDPKDYLDDCYRRDNYLKAYKHMLHPVKGPMFWPKSNAELIVPPTRKKKHGRPQKERRREELEGPKKSKLSRVGRIMRCSICRLEGHNKTKCPMSKETQPSNSTNMKNVANKRKAHASTSDSQSSKRKEKKKEAQHHVSVLNVCIISSIF